MKRKLILSLGSIFCLLLFCVGTSSAQVTVNCLPDVYVECTDDYSSAAAVQALMFSHPSDPLTTACATSYLPEVVYDNICTGVVAGDPVPTNLWSFTDGAMGAVLCGTATGGTATFTRNWSITVPSCGTDFFTQNYFVYDTENPIITLAGGLNQTCGTTVTYSTSAFGGDVEDTDLPTATSLDDCDGGTPAAITPTIDDDTASSTNVGTFTQPCTNSYTITWMATDNCGNSEMCMQTIEVVDDTAPVFTCPADFMVNGCDETNIISLNSAANMTLGQNGETGFQYSATRVSTDLSASGGVITATGTASTEDLVQADITENCTFGVDIEYQDAISSQTPCSSIIERTWTVTDAAGNTSTCVQTITVQDLEQDVFGVTPDIAMNVAGPIIGCDETDITNADGAGTSYTSLMYSTTAVTISKADYDSEVLSTGGSGTPALTVISGSCNNYTITYIDALQPPGLYPLNVMRTYTITDGCGATDSYGVTFTIDDNVFPVFASQPVDITVEGCTLADINNTTGVNATPGPGFTAIPYNTANTPITSAQFDADVLNSTNTVTLPTITDECDPADLTITHFDVLMSAAGDCPVIVERTFLVTDKKGNLTSTTQMITIEDVSVPVVNQSPADLVIEACDETDVETGTDATGLLSTALPYQNGGFGVPAASITEAQYEAELTSSGVAFTSGMALSGCSYDIEYMDALVAGTTAGCEVNTITRTFRIINPCDITMFVDVVQMIEIQDKTAPVINIAPADVTINSICDETMTMSGTAETGLDFSATMSVDITNIGFDAEITASTGTTPASGASITESCQATVEVKYIDVVAGTCPIVVTRTFTVDDNCGNTSTHVQTLTIVDDTDPFLTTTSVTTSITGCATTPPVAATDVTSLMALGFAMPTDNCKTYVGTDPVTSVDAFSGAGCTTTLTRTYTVIDDCGNSTTADHVITISDAGSAPVFTACPTTPIDLGCNPVYPTTADAEVDAGPANDDCGIAGLTRTTTALIAPVQTGCNGFTQVFQVTVTDACGMTDQCNVTYVWEEDFAQPTITTCPQTVTIACGASTSPVNTGGYPTVTDICTPAFMTTTSPSGTMAGFITYTDTPLNCGSSFIRIWTATDPCGNDSPSCAQTINVQAAITLTSVSNPPSTTVECGQSTAPTATGLPVATTNCTTGGPFYNYTDTSTTSTGGTCNMQTITRTWTITDNCGSTPLIYVQTISIVDTTVPQITCPQPITVACGTNPSPINTGGGAFVLDNCTSNFIVINSPSVPITGFVTYQDSASPVCGTTIVRTWTATDDCGNSANCTQNITFGTVVTSVTITNCPNPASIACGASSAPADTNGFPLANSNCTIGSIGYTYTDVGASSACGSTITRTWTATDGCGNTDTCVQTISVGGGTTAVTITCPANASITCGQSELPSNTGMATATSTCPGTPNPTPTHADGATTCSAGSVSFVRTWTVTDGCGNTDVCTQTITVNGVAGAAFMSPPADMNIACGAAFPTNPNLNYSNGQSGSCAVTGGPVSPTVDDSGLNSSACTGCRVVTWNTTDACGSNVFYQQNICYQNINCNNNTVLTGFNNGSNSNVQTAEDTEVNVNITSNQTILASPNGVDYDAGVDIDFLPGFCVQLGAEFHAFIDGCGGAMIQDDEDNTTNALNADEEGSTEKEENKETSQATKPEEK